ncbi:MAG: polysaccharide deacetylase family protein [Gemmatimonadota bacterium]|nr:polysaccharide deacetylase family protein [Gemmatimonadota bacterium]MDH3423020.1 polysaccharide deacetylase family protein [Gemmatimonadota bacterium]
MIPIQTRARRAILSALYHTHLYRLLERQTRGVGVIFTLHHTRPEPSREKFSPNRILEITPSFLDETIRLTQRLGYRAVSLDECRRRLVERDVRERFVHFAMDDGHADNYTHAFPVFRKHGVPFTIYVCTGLLDGSARQWWRDLEDVVAENDRVEVDLGDGRSEMVCRTPGQKHRTFEQIYWALRRMPHDSQMRTLQDVFTRHPPQAPSSPPMLSREMIQEMHDSGLLTVGAHTLTHPALSKLPPDALLEEMEESRSRISDSLGVEPTHFSYPYGDAGSAGPREFEAARRVGFATAVTNRKGVLHPEHRNHLHALPRISLNGDYQRTRYVEVLVSGVPFWLDPSLPRINVV